MKSRLLAPFPLLVLLSFLAALFISMTLFSAIPPQRKNTPSEADNRPITEKTSIDQYGNAAITRSVVYQNKYFPISKLRWTEDIDNASYKGYVKLIYFIYNRKESTTTANYSGSLSPQ